MALPARQELRRPIQQIPRPPAPQPHHQQVRHPQAHRPPGVPLAAEGARARGQNRGPPGARDSHALLSDAHGGRLPHARLLDQKDSRRGEPHHLAASPHALHHRQIPQGLLLNPAQSHQPRDRLLPEGGPLNQLNAREQAASHRPHRGHSSLGGSTNSRDTNLPGSCSC